MNQIPPGYIEVAPNVYERRPSIKPKSGIDVPIGNKRNLPIPQPAIRNESLAEAEGKKEDTGRVHIRIVFVRTRLIDPDNNISKWEVDCLRYAGVIKNDREQDVTIETGQRKAAKGEQEKTIIEVFS